MDLSTNIDIGIQSRNAKTGAARIRAALESIKRKSRQVANASQRDSAKMKKGMLGIKSAAVALIAVLAGKSLISSTKNFGQAVSDLAAITGASGKDLEFLRQKSKEFGETTTLSASQAAEAFKVIASAKPDLLENVDALAKVTEEAIALAEATGESLPTAANTLGSALNQFGKGAEDASRFINVLAAGSKRGAALVGEMSEALKFAGGIAANMGKLTFEETNASLQLLSQFAIKGSEAGTQFRMVLLSLETQANDKFKPSIVGLQDALDNLAAAELNTTEKAKLFGARNLNAADTLIVHRDKVAKLTEQLTGTNIAYEQQSIRTDNLAGDTLALKSAYEGLELTIGSELNSTLRGLTQAATDNIRALAKNPLLQKGVRVTLDTIHTALQDIKNVWNSLTEVLETSGPGIAVFEGAWTGAIENIVKWTKFLWQQFVVAGPANLKLGFTLMFAAFDRWNIALTSGVSTMVVLMLSQFDIFRANVIEKFQLIKTGVQIAFKTMSNVVGRTFDNIRVSITSAVDAILGDIQQKVFTIARTLAEAGFGEMADSMTDMGIALGKMATQGDKARASAKANEEARLRELEVLENLLIKIRDEAEEKRRLARDTADILIREYEDTASAAVLASQAAVQGAIEERDATILAIEALRTKRAEIRDGGRSTEGTGAPGGTAVGTVVSGIEAAGDAYEKLNDIQKGVVDNMSDGFAEMAASGSASFKELANSVIQDIIRMVLKAKLLKIFSAIFGGLGKGGVDSGGFDPGFAIGGIEGGRTGLDFTVGGVGGTDSQLVAFKATPGEDVSVKTPQQQKDASGGGGGLTVSISNVIDARGADEASIMAKMPGLLESNKQQTIAAILDLNNKGALRVQ